MSLLHSKDTAFVHVGNRTTHTFSMSANLPKKLFYFMKHPD